MGVPRFPILMSTTMWCFVVSGVGADLGRRSARTPYDPYFGAVISVMNGLDSAPAEIDEVRAKLRHAHQMRHSYDPDRPYVPQRPSVTDRVGVGDCKAKALWLAQELNDSRTRFVVGRYRGAQSRSHAWLLWSNGESWWILDPTFYGDPVPVSRSNSWIPYYSYSKGGRYVHSSAP